MKPGVKRLYVFLHDERDRSSLMRGVSWWPFGYTRDQPASLRGCAHSSSGFSHRGNLASTNADSPLWMPRRVAYMGADHAGGLLLGTVSAPILPKPALCLLLSRFLGGDVDQLLAMKRLGPYNNLRAAVNVSRLAASSKVSHLLRALPPCQCKP